MYDLTNLPHPVVIFEIDNPTPDRVARFARFLSENKAVGKTKFAYEMGMGSWEGNFNHCFVLEQTDFNLLIAQSSLPSWIKDQDAVMAVNMNHRATIIFQSASASSYEIGAMTRATPSEMVVDGMTYLASSLNDGAGFTILASGIYAAR